MLFNGDAFEIALSSSDQKKYLQLAQQGDKNAKEIFVKHNLRLIVSVLNKYYKSYDEETKNELFSVGCLGLWKAVKYFNPSFKTKFSTYAIPMIHGEMRRFIYNNNNIHIPMDIKELSCKILKLQEEYYRKNNIEKLSPDQIAKILNVNEDDVLIALNSIKPIKSLHSAKFVNKKTGAEISLEEFVKDDNFVIYENIEKKEIYEDLIKNLENLLEEEKKVIQFLFGINCSRKNQRETAELLKISQPQVSRLKKSAIKKLENILPKYIKDEYEKKSNSEETKTITKLESKKIKNIFEYYPGYTKIEILNAINSLNYTNKKIIELAYGLNDNKVTNIENIAKLLNLKVTSVNVYISNSRKMIQENLTTTNANNGNVPTEKIQSILDLFPDYSEREIMLIINSLSEVYIKILELKFGINNDKIFNNKEITKSLNIDNLINYQKEQNIQISSAKTIKKVEEKILTIEDKLTLNQDFEVYKEEIKMLINMLNDPTQQIILLLRLGFLKNKNYSEEQIAKFLNIDTADVHNLINDALNNIHSIVNLTSKSI